MNLGIIRTEQRFILPGRKLSTAKYADGWDFDRIFRRLVALYNEEMEIERQELVQWARVIQMAPEVVEQLKTVEGPE